MKAVLGFDIHKLVPGRKCIICGVEIPYEKGLLGHSDGDVGIHALIDAICAGTGLPDIGVLFPDTDPQYKNISSITLLQKVLKKIEPLNVQFKHVDFTFICDKPKLSPYYEKMKENIANFLKIDSNLISIKAKTTEGLMWNKKEEAIACFCVLTLE